MLKRLSKMSLAISMISLSSCVTSPVQLHPELTVPATPDLPKFTRTMLNCGYHNPNTLNLCKRIKQREAYLLDHIETLNLLIEVHNTELN